MPNINEVSGFENFCPHFSNINERITLRGTFMGSGSANNKVVDISDYVCSPDINRTGSVSCMFMNSKYESIILPNDSLQFSNCGNFSNMFDSCSNLIYLNNNFHAESMIDCSYMFNNCSSLKKIDVLSYVISKNSNLSYMFNGCSNLEGISCKFDTN